MIPENNKFSLVKCESCHLVFSERIFSQDEFKKIYDHLYNSENPKYKNHSIRKLEQMSNGEYSIGYNRKRILHKHITPSATILEIGSGNGLLGCYPKEKFPNTNYTGIELDMEMSKKARSFGLKIINGDFSVLENIEEKFELIFRWEVLEHIQDLDRCIKLISNALKKRRKIYFFSSQL